MHTYRLLPAYVVQYLVRKPSPLYSVTSECNKVVLLLSLVSPCCLSEILQQMQAAYLLAELAEHPCTHQLIIQHGSIAAILRIMHATCQACTTARTLDSVAARQLPHPTPTQLSEAVTCDASAFNGNSSSFMTGKPFLDVLRPPVDQAQSAVSDFAWDFGRVSTTPDQHTGRNLTDADCCDVQADSGHPLEDLRKGHPNSAAELADSASGNALSNDVSRTDSGDFASSGAKSVDLASGAFGLSGVASNTADAASAAVPSSMANTGSSSSSSSSSSDSAGAVMGGPGSPSDGIMAEQAEISMHSSITSSNNARLAVNAEGHYSSSSSSSSSSTGTVGGVASTSIHSRLLQAAQAAAHTEAACSSSGRKTDTTSGLPTCLLAY